MYDRVLGVTVFLFILSSCVSGGASSGRRESVMMDGYDVCKDAAGGAGELIQKINNKFAKAVDELGRRTNGPAFAARLSEKNLQWQNAQLDVLETSANQCISTPVKPALIAHVRKSRDEAQATYDRWMAKAPGLFKDQVQGPTDADIEAFINMLAAAANAYNRAQASGPVNQGSGGPECVDREVVNTTRPYCN